MAEENETSALARTLLAQRQAEPVESSIEDDLLVAVSTLLAAAGGIETGVSLMLLDLACIYPLQVPLIYPLVVGQTIGTKLGQLRRLIRLRMGNNRTAIKELLEAIKPLQEAFTDRDMFAHQLISPGRNAGEIGLQDPRTGSNGLPCKPQYFTASEIRGFARQLREAFNNLQEKIRAHGILPMVKEYEKEHGKLVLPPETHRK